MTVSQVSLPARWETFLKRLADDHKIDLDAVVRELCEWAFSNTEGKEQFSLWLDDAYPAEEEGEEEAKAAGEEAGEEEEEDEEESEEESHDHRD
jgi:hypothetical protein